MKNQKLSDQEIASKLAELNSHRDDSSNPWQLKDGKLNKEFIFKNFIRAMGFMMQSAIVAEKMNHHPEWSNVYKTVHVDLITHSASGITELDFDLAKKMNGLCHD